MQLHALRIQDFRSFVDARMEFLCGRSAPAGSCLPNVNVLLGGNGAGKSTVLRAIALSVLAPVLERGTALTVRGLVRRLAAPSPRAVAADQMRPVAPDAARIEAVLRIDDQDAMQHGARPGADELVMAATIGWIGDGEELDWMRPADPAAARRVREAQLVRETSAFFLVGYGATRRVGTASALSDGPGLTPRTQRYHRVAGLFEDHALVPLVSWLPAHAARNPGRYRQVVNLINTLLPEDHRLLAAAVDQQQGEPLMFDVRGVPLPFDSLSDGNQAYIGWVGDMLFHLCMGAPSGRRLVDNQGVVLVDEIDLHLHPDWQRSILPTLSRALPHIQFIVTTHSPLVVGSLQPQNILVLHGAGEAGTTCLRLAEQVHGRSAEQLLLSPYFGLSSTRAPDVAARLAGLKAACLAGDQRAAADYLQLLSSGGI